MNLHAEPLLTREDEVALAALIAAGRDAAERLRAGESSGQLRRAVRDGERARDRFIRANTRLVESLARRRTPTGGLEHDDLVQEGMLGLIHAVEKFDHRKGFKFSTYAAWWIRQYIDRCLDRAGPCISIPVHAGRSLAQERKGASPHTDMTRAVAMARRPLWLDRPNDNLHGATLHEVIAGHATDPEDEAERNDLAEYVRALVDRLPRQQAEVIRMRFGIGREQVAQAPIISKETGVGYRDVWATQRAALALLKEMAA